MNGKVSCEFDEFDEDNIQNQILKATISKLIKTENIDRENKNQGTMSCNLMMNSIWVNQ